MGGSGRGHRIINCETSYNNFLRISAGWHSGGCKFIPFCSDIVMSGHVAAYNYECPGIWFDGGNFNITVENSVCHHNICGIFYEISERGTFRNNVCYDNTEWGGIALSSCSDCQVLNNVLYHNYASGVACNGPDRAWSPLGEGDKQRLPARNNVIWGNIFVNDYNPDSPNKGRDNAELLMPEGVDLNTGNISDYNIFYRGPDSALRLYKGGNAKSCNGLSEWQSKTGWDAHSIAAEPLFVDAANHNFHPVKGSPAIDFVKPRMGGVYQFDGSRRLPDPIPEGKILRFTAGPFEAPSDLKPSK
jgi:parallel beta-helix repeat protein